MIPRPRLAYVPRALLTLPLALGLLLPVALGNTLPVHAAAATWTVSTTNDTASPSPSNCSGTTCPTLRDALVAAQSGDTINLSGLSGIITTTSTLDVFSNVSIVGPGAASLTVSGNQDHTVFYIPAGVTAAISGLTLSNGQGSYGGAISNQGTLTLTSSTLSNNSAQYGGGIFNQGATSALTVDASTFSANSASFGGAMYSDSSASITASTVAGNSAAVNGGGITSAGSLTIVASTFANNTTTYRGGGIYSAGPLFVTASTFAANSANFGGGMLSQDSATLTDSTIAGNTASFGGGIVSDGYEGTAALTATNTLLAGNSGSACGYYATALSADLGGNLDDDNSCGFSSPASQPGVTNPGLGTLGDNGGPTQTIPLLPGSPARTLGVTAGCLANGGLDQRGVLRPASGCSSGAFQVSAPLTPATLPAATVDSTYTQAFSLTGGTAPITYTAMPGTPPGLSLDSGTGVLSGIPTTAGTFPLTVTALDSQASFGSQVYNFTVQQATTSLSLAAGSATLDLGQSLPVTATLTAPMTPTAPTGTVVFTLTSDLGASTVLTATLTGTQAGVTFPTQSGAHSYTLSAAYSGDANFLPSSASLAGSITQLGCTVNGSVTQYRVGSLTVQHLSVPSTAPGRVLGLLDGVLTVNQPTLTACSTSGATHTATISGTAGGGDRLFPPGTALTVLLTTTADGAAGVTISGGGQSATLSGAPTTSPYRLTISAF